MTFFFSVDIFFVFQRFFPLSPLSDFSLLVTHTLSLVVTISLSLSLSVAHTLYLSLKMGSKYKGFLLSLSLSFSQKSPPLPRAAATKAAANDERKPPSPSSSHVLRPTSPPARRDDVASDDSGGEDIGDSSADRDEAGAVAVAGAAAASASAAAVASVLEEVERRRGEGRGGEQKEEDTARESAPAMSLPAPEARRPRPRATPAAAPATAPATAPRGRPSAKGSTITTSAPAVRAMARSTWEAGRPASMHSAANCVVDVEREQTRFFPPCSFSRVSFPFFLSFIPPFFRLGVSFDPPPFRPLPPPSSLCIPTVTSREQEEWTARAASARAPAAAPRRGPRPPAAAPRAASAAAQRARAASCGCERALRAVLEAAEPHARARPDSSAPAPAAAARSGLRRPPPPPLGGSPRPRPQPRRERETWERTPRLHGEPQSSQRARLRGGFPALAEVASQLSRQLMREGLWVCACLVEEERWDGWRREIWGRGSKRRD